MIRLVSIVILLCLTTAGLYAQTKTILGRVITEQFDAAAFVAIEMSGLEVGMTDSGGFFRINIPISAREIQFRAVGIDSTIIELGDSCNEFEIITMLSANYDFLPAQKVDRLRLKRFKQLPAIRRKAVARGVFRMEKPCYKQKFRVRYVKG